jgi:hypothetical protein
MGPTLEIAPLTERDVDALYETGMDDVRDAFDDALLILHDLFQRYTGSWFGVQIPEEDRALQLLEDRLSLLSPGDPHRERIAQDLRAFLQFREQWAREGPSADTERAAQNAADTLHEQWTTLIEYPLAPDPVENRQSASR